MANALGWAALALLFAVAALWGKARREGRRMERVWQGLADAAAAQERFGVEMVEGLPAPARRYLLRAIAVGAPLAGSVVLTMRGSLQLQPGGKRLPMRGRQILSVPRGLLWRARVGRGLLFFSGYDVFYEGQGRMRWGLWGLLPLVLAAGPDISRSAAGRVALESFWHPAALLPKMGARWEALDDRRARVSLQVGGEEMPLTLEVDGEGRLLRVAMERWCDVRRRGHFEPITFEGRFLQEGTFHGYTLPTEVVGGWQLEGGYYDFFHAELLGMEPAGR